MADFKPVLKDIESQIAVLADATVTKYKDEAVEDGKQILSLIKDDLIRWMELLSQGLIKPSEFEWLVNSDKEMIKLTGLKKAGLAKIRAEQFGMGVLNVIANTTLNSLTKTADGVQNASPRLQTDPIRKS